MPRVVIIDSYVLIEEDFSDSDDEYKRSKPVKRKRVSSDKREVERKRKQCKYSDFTKIPNFGFKNGKREYCSKRKLDGMTHLSKK